MCALGHKQSSSTPPPSPDLNETILKNESLPEMKWNLLSAAAKQYQNAHLDPESELMFLFLFSLCGLSQFFHLTGGTDSAELHPQVFNLSLQLCPFWKEHTHTEW